MWNRPYKLSDNRVMLILDTEGLNSVCINNLYKFYHKTKKQKNYKAKMLNIRS